MARIHCPLSDEVLVEGDGQTVSEGHVCCLSMLTGRGPCPFILRRGELPVLGLPPAAKPPLRGGPRWVDLAATRPTLLPGRLALETD